MNLNESNKRLEEVRKELKIIKAAKFNFIHDDKHDGNLFSITYLIMILIGHRHSTEHSYDPNHATIEVVRKELKLKDQELQQVNSRLRRMLFVWNRGQLMKKTAWLERNNMMEEIEALRLELQNVKTSKCKLKFDLSC